MFGGERESAPNLSVPEIRRPIIACLRKSLRALTGLYNPDDYTVTKDHDNTFSVHIEPDLVFVNQLNDKEPVALKESKLYQRWASL